MDKGSFDARSPGPSDDIPNTHAAVPFERAFSYSWATFAELQAAGFHVDQPTKVKGRSAPTLELRIHTEVIWLSPEEAAAQLAGSTFPVLRDEAGHILATWNEDRWWTPEESDAYTKAIVRRDS